MKTNMKIHLLMSGSCHLDRVSNVEIGVECQIFVIVIFFNCSRVLQFGAHSRYYKGALTQKRNGLKWVANSNLFTNLTGHRVVSALDCFPQQKFRRAKQKNARLKI